MKFKEQNLPNKLTTLRMIAVPVIFVLFVLYILNVRFNLPTNVVLFSYENENYKALTHIEINLLQVIIMLIGAAASITDCFDGKIARKRNIVSEYGMLMDPLADKLLVNTTLVLMMIAGMFVGKEGGIAIKVAGTIVELCAVLLIARDFIVDALRAQALKKGVVVPASIWGKLKTSLLMPGICTLICGSFHLFIYIIGLAMVFVGCMFGIIGGYKYYKQIKGYVEN